MWEDLCIGDIKVFPDCSMRKKEFMTKQVTVKFQNTKDNQKILKTVEEKKLFIKETNCTGTIISIGATGR